MTQAPSTDLSQALAKTHAFFELSASELQQIATLASIEEFEPGDVVVEQGSHECDLVVVLDGELRVLDAFGDRLADLGPGASVGEMALLDQQPRSATVVAKQRTTVAVLPSLDLWMLFERQPQLGKTVLFNIGRVLASRLRSANTGR